MEEQGQGEEPTSKIKQNYLSPRWSGEVCDCSMPVALDTYNTCSYNCLYCFAFFQKSHTDISYKYDLNNSKNREVRSVNPEKIRNLFTNCLNDDPQTPAEKQMYPYIKDRVTIQWNGLADGFDEWERQFGVTLELLKFFDEIDYPLSMGTKATWWTEDNRYMKLMKKHPHNWHMKVSINTLDEQKALAMEEYCPTPHERLEAIGRLTDLDMHVTLRLRPYIIGYSEDYPRLIHEASNQGADSIVTEFLCLDNRATPQLLEKYSKMSKIVGYDIREFYRKNSTNHILMRLNYKIKRPIIKNMKKVAHNHHMRFYVSDAHHKEKCDMTCCCGTPPHMKTYKGQYNHALTIAKQKKDHIVYWKDIEPYVNRYMSHFKWYDSVGFNTGFSRTRVRRWNQTMADYLREIWNNPKDTKSPYKYFDGVLYPIGLDEKNNVIYKLNIKKMKS